MDWQFSLYSLGLVFAAGLALSLAAIAWPRRATPGGRPFAVLMLAVAEWTLLNAGERLALGTAARVWCAQAEYLGIASVPTLWLLFALRYSHQDHWLTPRRAACLWIMPSITVAVAATNPWHRLLWVDIVPATAAVGAPLIYRHGTWFWLFTTYNYFLLFSGSFALATAIYRFPHRYRRQTFALLTGVAIPWLINVLYLTGLGPTGFDLTPFAFTLSGVLFGWGMLRWQLFDLVPVARDAIIESMSDGIVVVDAGHRIADINPAAQRMLGATAAASAGQRADTALAAWPELVTHLDAEQETQVEIRLLPDAATYLDVHIAPLRDRDGQLTGHVLLLRDSSERRLVDQMREDLTHALVHDLRNPLMSISGAIDLLAEGVWESRAPVVRKMVEIARANIRRLLTLVDSLLDVSRLESGQLPLQRQPLQLRDLIAEALQMQMSLATERGLRLVNEISAEQPSVYADARLIARVLQNLIDNATKFTPAGGTIRVNARGDPQARQVVVTVSDDGLGIPADIQGRLFQKFVSGDATGQGSGLGLAFCRLAVEAHGGRIWAESRVPRGTTVTFALPLAAPP